MDSKLLSIRKAYSSMNGGDINPEGFFRHKTDLPYYDDAFGRGEARIALMTPDQYFSNAAKVLGTDRMGVPVIEVMIKIGRSRRTIDELKKKRGLDMPMIDFRKRLQEGIRRMAAAKELFGENARFPVLVVDEEGNGILK